MRVPQWVLNQTVQHDHAHQCQHPPALDSGLLAYRRHAPEGRGCDQQQATGQPELGEHLQDDVVRMIDYFFGQTCWQLAQRQEVLPGKSAVANAS